MAESRNTDAETFDVSSLAVVTVAFRSNEVLPGLLDSIRQATTQSPMIVIVDNAPDSNSSAADVARRYDATYISRADNPGYGAAVNAGVAALPRSISWLLICNPDLYFDPNAIDILLDVAKDDERIASVGPRILDPDGAIYPSARPIPSLRVGVGHAVFANVWRSNPWTARYKRPIDPSSTPRSVGWLSGSCLLIRRDAFMQIGGFDESYFMYFEDVDLGFRFSKAGYSNVFVPEAVATHIGGHSTRTATERMVKAHHDSAKRFVASKYPGPVLAPLRLALRLGLSTRSAIQQRAARKGSQVR